MFGRFMPQEGKFFDLFNAHAEQIVLGGQALVELIGALVNNPEEALKHAESIDAYEEKADQITHETIGLMHSTFITPFDRDEIHQLISGLDDILDLIQDVAESMNLYDIRRVTPEAKNLADLSLSCCERVRTAVGLLDSMDNSTAILKTCREIDQLESDADRVMRGAMSKLFRDEQDVRQILKLKAIYELLETVTDRCEDVANIIEGIVLENS
jgi:predicted phosphate transport protein (TIGR00153 family)